MATVARIQFNDAQAADLNLADILQIEENSYSLYYTIDGAGFSYRYLVNQFVPATPTTVIPWHRIFEVTIAL